MRADREFYQRYIEGTEPQIGMVVYELFGLTEEEIKTVEQCPIDW